MGGQSSQQAQQQQNTSQNQVSNPWAPAQGLLGNILGNAQNLAQPQNLYANPTQQAAITQLTNQGWQGNPWAGNIGNLTSNLFGGGGVGQFAQPIQQAMNQYQQAVSPYITNPGQMPPGMQDVLNTITSDTSNAINSEFAGAGRFGSGLNQQDLARGLSQGLAAPLLGQYNTNIQNALSTAQNLFGNQLQGVQGLLGVNQQGLANQAQGATTADQALAAQQYGPQQLLAAQQQNLAIPQAGLSFLASLGVPIAGLGGQVSGQTTGTTSTQGTSNLSPAAQALGWSNVFSNFVSPFHGQNPIQLPSFGGG
jgi:hypothetical protein